MGKNDFEALMAGAGATSFGTASQRAQEPPVSAPPDPEVEQIRAIMATGTPPPELPPYPTLVTPPPMNLTLVTKLATIMADPEFDKLEPAEWNDKQRYHFWSIEQITGLIRGRFAKAGIVFVPSILDVDIRDRTTKAGGSSWMTTLRVSFTLINEDDPTDRLVGIGIGQGDDPGDKGANKAFTGAVKTWLKYLFLIGGKDDAELDESTDIRYEDDGVRDRSRVDRRDDRDARPARDTDAVRIEPSNIEGIERGGRSSRASEVQVQRVRDLTRQAGVSMSGLADLIEKTIGDTLRLGSTADTAREVMLDYLGRLSADSIGKLIQELDEMAAEAAQGGALDDPGDPGYGG